MELLLCFCQMKGLVKFESLGYFNVDIPVAPEYPGREKQALIERFYAFHYHFRK